MGFGLSFEGFAKMRGVLEISADLYRVDIKRGGRSGHYHLDLLCQQVRAY